MLVYAHLRTITYKRFFCHFFQLANPGIYEHFSYFYKKINKLLGRSTFQIILIWINFEIFDNIDQTHIKVYSMNVSSTYIWFLYSFCTSCVYTRPVYYLLMYTLRWENNHKAITPPNNLGLSTIPLSSVGAAARAQVESNSRTVKLIGLFRCKVWWSLQK